MKPDHPRIRGEHRSGGRRQTGFLGSSPHTRGAQRRFEWLHTLWGIIPAYAGSTLRSSPRLKLLRDHPRIRGEHVRAMDANGLAHGSSPHTRGARMGRVHDPRRRRIIPAYAGSTTATAPLARKGRDHPRIRGEHSSSFSRSASQPGSSPHTRGALDEAALESCERGIIPAYAGSTRSGPLWTGSTWDHPRIRGEHLRPDRPENLVPGSSPHTRGARPESDAAGRVGGIIPAYAGSTAAPTAPDSKARDHPRIRGEHRRRPGRDRRRSGSSPHTRGAPRRDRGARIRQGIIPAYAGSTWQPASWPEPPPDHPRIRGEHDFPSRTARPGPGSSPHTRGALTGELRLPIGPGIIPAYAGSTKTFFTTLSLTRDHPRIRGEHSGEGPHRLVCPGSSPHTRGARS